MASDVAEMMGCMARQRRRELATLVFRVHNGDHDHAHEVMRSCRSHANNSTNNNENSKKTEFPVLWCGALCLNVGCPLNRSEEQFVSLRMKFHHARLTQTCANIILPELTHEKRGIPQHVEL